jgi:DNA-binding beta-propeller fold protein YncE
MILWVESAARAGRVVANVTVADVEGGSVYPAGSAVNSRRSRFYVVTSPWVTNSPPPVRSTLSGLDAQSGHLVRTLTLPRVAMPAVIFSYPAIYPAVAVDEQTGRLFIANGDDNSVSVLDTARL